jgi:hypothetical protein
MASLAMAPVAQAATLSFDDNLLSGGTLSFLGSGGSLSGTSLIIDSVKGIGTPSNSGPSYTCSGCSLNFATGNLLSSSSSGGVTSYLFGAGGSISLTGNGPGGASGTLASGTFSAPVSVQVAAPYIAVQFGLGTDQKNDNLEAFFGYPASQPWIFASSSIAAQAVTGGLTAYSAFSGTVTNVDFDNTPVPVPAAVWLFGSALAGMGIIGRRKAATA